VYYLNIEIPKPVPMAGWKELPINECGEPLVHLNPLAPKLIFVRSGYAHQGIPGASHELYARESVANRLIQAAEVLQVIRPNARLQIEDAYRPYEVQAVLFEDIKADLRAKYPRWREETFDRRAQKYVSKPSKDPLKPAPHITGGAIDLTIIENGKELEMGTVWDYFGPKASTAYFERAARRPQTLYRDNRRLLFYVMTRAGFTNYPEEWWHFDFGNQFWTQVSGQGVAKYSFIKSPYDVGSK
jgi:zinc D-Ala-D-Ala dipeptidase